MPLAHALGVYERKLRPLSPNASLESVFKKYKGRVPRTEIEVGLLSLEGFITLEIIFFFTHNNAHSIQFVYVCVTVCV